MRRRLDEATLDYLFLDATFFRMHPGSPAEPVLAAWGITTGGKPAFICLAPGTNIDDMVVLMVLKASSRAGGLPPGCSSAAGQLGLRRGRT